MNHTENLDFFLEYISKKDKYTYSQDIYSELKDVYSKTELTLTVEKLHLDKYIDLKFSESPTVDKISPPYYCRINYHGLRFLERGGYKLENKRIKQRTIWTNAKIITTVLNAITIIVIAFISGIYVPYNLNKKDETIKLKEKEIKTLNLKVDSLTTIIQKTNQHD